MFNLFTLFNLCSAVVVTRTELAYYTVTVYEGQPEGSVATAAATSTLLETSSDVYTTSVSTHGHAAATVVTISDLASSAAASDNADVSTIYLVYTSADSLSESSTYADLTTSTIVSTTSTTAPTTSTTSSTSSSTPVPTTTSTTTSTTTTPVQTTTSTTAQPTTTTTTTSATPTTSSTTTTSDASSTSTSATASASSTLTSFEQDIVDYHNMVRAQHQAGPVVWNSTIAQFASDYLASDDCVFKHSGGPYGENIAMGYSTPDGAMEAWYDEYVDYDYAAGEFSESTGHFTQMVWVSTTSVGCALDACNGRPFLVCEYWPRGNVIGYFTENVLE